MLPPIGIVVLFFDKAILRFLLVAFMAQSASIVITSWCDSLDRKIIALPLASTILLVTAVVPGGGGIKRNLGCVLLLLATTIIRWRRGFEMEPATFARLHMHIIVGRKTTFVTRVLLTMLLMIPMVMTTTTTIMRRRAFGWGREFDWRNISTSVVVSIYVNNPLRGAVRRVFVFVILPITMVLVFLTDRTCIIGILFPNRKTLFRHEMVFVITSSSTSSRDIDIGTAVMIVPTVPGFLSGGLEHHITPLGLRRGAVDLSRRQTTIRVRVRVRVHVCINLLPPNGHCQGASTRANGVKGFRKQGVGDVIVVIVVVRFLVRVMGGKRR